MTRTIAIVSMSLLCAAASGAYFYDGARAQTPTTSTAAASPTDTGATTPAPRTKARKDVGCVGYHGSSHGYSRNGHCVIPKNKKKTT
jgi:hypothetical protein